MNEKNLKRFWLFSIFIVLALFSIYLVYINKDNNNVPSKEEESYTIVKNYSDFYTVNSCVYRYLTYLQSSNVDSLLKVIDEEYIKINGITGNNIFNYLNRYEGNVNFSSQKMYEEKLSDSIYNYYVYGYVEKDVMDSFPEKTDAYFIVKLDKKNNLWTIKPYDGNIFG